VGVGWNAKAFSHYLDWVGRVKAFLHQTLGGEVEAEFLRIAVSEDPADWERCRSEATGMLEGIVAARLASNAALDSVGAAATVAGFLERLGLESVILHEKPNEGQTVIEKIEAHSDVGFAVVLLTPDDVGAAKADAARLQTRARQNVVLELGYFVGKLKRSRVCALYTSGVQIPSDFSGILYVELDQKGRGAPSLRRSSQTLACQSTSRVC
jgi:hypothetical protein